MTSPLQRAAAEIEAHVGRSGWEAPPTLFALVRTARISAQDPEAASTLGLDRNASGDALTPIEQDGLPAGQLDEVLGQIMWPDSVDGCGVSQHVVLLPPAVDAEVGIEPGDAIDAALAHPDRREARLVATVLRDGSSAVVLRLRAVGGAGEDDLLTGPDLAPNLVAALLATFA